MEVHFPPIFISYNLSMSNSSNIVEPRPRKEYAVSWPFSNDLYIESAQDNAMMELARLLNWKHQLRYRFSMRIGSSVLGIRTSYKSRTNLVTGSFEWLAAQVISTTRRKKDAEHMIMTFEWDWPLLLSSLVML